MKKMRKTALLLACVTLMGAFAGCSGEKEVAEGEKMTIRWMGFPIDGTGKPDGEIEKYIEEKFDVELEPIFITYGEYVDKKAMMLAGDDIPDVIYEFDPKHVKQDADQGFIAEIPYEFIKKNAPDIYNMLNKEEPRVWSYSRVEDKNYGIPNLSHDGNNVTIGIWRKDWLDNVGINKIPETIDEVGDALYKFTHNDPDGNGKDDTYGMTGATSWNSMFINVFGAYGAMPFNWVKTENGEYKYGGLQPETTQALNTLAKWYSEGLIHPDFINDALSGTAKDKFANGKIGYLDGLGGYYDKSDATAVQNLTKELNPDAEVVDSHPTKGPDGKSGGFIWGSAAHIVAFGEHLEEDEAKLKKILEILNTMVSDEEVLLNVRLGKEGTTYKLADGAAEVSDGIEFIAPYDDAEYRKESGLVNDFGSPTYFMPVTPLRASYEKFTNKEKIKAYADAAGDTKGTTDAFLKPDVLPSSAEYFETLRNAQIKLMVEIITGKKTADVYQTEFNEIWNQYGGNVLEGETVQVAENIENILAELGIE